LRSKVLIRKETGRTILKSMGAVEVCVLVAENSFHVLQIFAGQKKVGGLLLKKEGEGNTRDQDLRVHRPPTQRLKPKKRTATVRSRVNKDARTQGAKGVSSHGRGGRADAARNILRGRGKKRNPSTLFLEER